MSDLFKTICVTVIKKMFFLPRMSSNGRNNLSTHYMNQNGDQNPCRVE